MPVSWLTRRGRRRRYHRQSYNALTRKIKNNKQKFHAMVWLHKLLYKAVKNMRSRRNKIIVDYIKCRNNRNPKHALQKWDKRIFYSTFILKRIAIDMLKTDALKNPVTRHLSLHGN